MASWFERKIARPLKDAVKSILQVREIKEHPYAGQMLFDPFGVDLEKVIPEKVIPESLKFTDNTEQNVYLQYVIIAAVVFVFFSSMNFKPR